MAEIGRICIVVAFIIVAYSTVASAIGAIRKQADLLASARNGIYASAALVSLAWGALLYAFAVHDFSILYVVRYNSRDTDLAFSLSGAYAGQEGSLLLWAWGILVAMLVVTLLYRKRYKVFLPWVISVMGLVATFFLALLTVYSDPFVQIAAIPPDGQGLNPLLENVGMLFHPPALYVGYIAYTVPFALAMAALITGRLDNEWIEIARPWTLFAWGFLGIGNLLGAQWAYVELGWGGYWGWDPVENSSLMPWLTGTAFLHSVSIQRRRGMFKIWSLVLIITTFILTIFGTLITRSDLLSSVHTFGESSVGPVFTTMIVAILVFSTILIWARRGRLKDESDLEHLVSRESGFLLSNLLLVGAAFAVFWGTIFPIISEFVGGIRVTMNADFFNQVVGPILFAVVLLMGICPLMSWRRVSPGRLMSNLRIPIVVAATIAAAVWLIGFSASHVVAVTAACGLCTTTILLELFRGNRTQGRLTSRNALFALGSMVWKDRPRYGGYLVHLGIVLIAIGVVFSLSSKAESEVTLAPSQETSIGSYRLVFQGLSASQESRKEVITAEIDLYSSDRKLGTMTPTKEFYRGFKNPNTEVSIYSTPWEDLYVILNGWSPENVELSLVINPMVSWIWVGGYILILGTGIAFLPDIRQTRSEITRPLSAHPPAGVATTVDR